MPKHEILHTAGTPLSDDLRVLVKKFFKEADAIRLQRFGGKVTISITAPYIAKKTNDILAVVIDQAYISALSEFCSKSEMLKKKLSELSLINLKEIAKIIKYPVRKQSTRQDLIEQLCTYFRSEKIWRKIAGLEAKPQEESSNHDSSPSKDSEKDP